jgi:ribonuclease HII
MATASSLRDRLIVAPRDRQLRFLASAIHHFTLMARSGYGTPEPYQLMREVNESIHRLSGHLRDLTNATEPMTEDRADAIMASANHLHPGELELIEAHSPL